MKRLLAIFYIFVLVYMPAIGYTGPKEDYEEAYQLYISAGASVAAYNGRIGELARGYLKQEGWTIDHYVQAPGHTGATMENTPMPGKVKLLTTLPYRRGVA